MRYGNLVRACVLAVFCVSAACEDEQNEKTKGPEQTGDVESPSDAGAGGAGSDAVGAGGTGLVGPREALDAACKKYCDVMALTTAAECVQGDLVVPKEVFGAGEGGAGGAPEAPRWEDVYPECMDECRPTDPKCDPSVAAMVDCWMETALICSERQDGGWGYWFSEECDPATLEWLLCITE